MNNEELNICLTYSEYEKLFNTKSKQIFVNSNLEKVFLPEILIESFIEKRDYFNILKDSLNNKANISFNLVQGEEILIKNIYSPLSIVLGIKYKENFLDNELKREFKVILNKINFNNYLIKNKDKVFKFSIDGNDKKISYNNLFSILFDTNIYDEFISNNHKYLDLSKPEFVYALKEFITTKKIFLVYQFNEQSISLYKSLFEKYDTEAINKYLITSFKYSDKVNINEYFFNQLLYGIPKNASLIEKTIYIYLNLLQILRYDFEVEADTDIIKKHKDFTRIEEIDSKNNKVFPYEFMCLFAKILEKLKINFDYDEKFIVARIEKYLVKYKAISSTFNGEILSQLDLIKGISILNININTKNDFSKIISKISNNIYKKNINIQIVNMPFEQLLNVFKVKSNKISISFNEKYELFLNLISSANLGNDSLGYIYKLKTIIFNETELNSNISFATVAEYTSEIKPVVIITINSININLYNSNKYIYFNPPQKIKIYNLNEIRYEFFNGRLKYIKGSSDNIIGVEKNNIC